MTVLVRRLAILGLSTIMFVGLFGISSAQAASSYLCNTGKVYTSKTTLILQSDGDGKKSAIRTYIKSRRCVHMTANHYFDQMVTGVAYWYPYNGGNLCGEAYMKPGYIKFNPDSVGGRDIGDVKLNCKSGGARWTLDLRNKTYWDGRGGGNRCLGGVLKHMGGHLFFRDRPLPTVCIPR